VKIVVTGGAGFVGSHYVRTLLGGGYPACEHADVVVLDNLTSAGNPANLAPVADDPRLTVVEGDVLDAAVVDEVVADADLLVHFAAETAAESGLVRPITRAANLVPTNVAGTQELLDAAVRRRVERMVHVSTAEVFGSMEHGAWRESDRIAARSPYGASRAAAERLALSYARTHGLDVVVTRCSDNYGPYQLPDEIVPLVVTNLFDGKPVPLYGEGRHVREMLHVTDHCAGVQLVAERGRTGEVYHVGGGTPLTDRELTARLLELCGADWSMVEPVPGRAGHGHRPALSWAKIAEQLGYSPRVDLGEGLLATVDWYRDNRGWWQPLKDRAALWP
jgi:dTDP-glucose 4,6-dehydratase